MKQLITKILMAVLFVSLVGCSTEIDDFSPESKNTEDSLDSNQKSEIAIREISNITNSMLKRYENNLSKLNNKERDDYSKYVGELTKGSEDNLEELIKALGYQSVDEYEKVIRSLKSQIEILEENNPDFIKMDFSQKLTLFNANNDVAAMGFNCAGEYYECKSSADNNFTVAAVGCVVAGAGTFITAGCVWVAESLHESAVLNCRADYMICNMN